jgi:hypothetical protein
VTFAAAHATIRGPDPRRASLALACAGAVAVMAVVTLLYDNLSFPHVPYLFFFIAGMIVVLREPSPEMATAPATVPVEPMTPAPRSRKRRPAPRVPAGAPALN